MGTIDLHSKPFDEETITKLEIFEDYAKAWLPTFIMQRKPVICVFDFFAGTGYDNKGVAGSPIRVLKKIQEQRSIIFQNNVHLELYLNEFEPNRGKKQEKFEALKKSCNEFLDEHPGLDKRVRIKYFNEDCETLFPKLLPQIKLYPSLVYLDQNGVKFAHEKYFLAFDNMRETDFLFFISSSYIVRFGHLEEFKKHIDIDLEEAKKDAHRFIHRSVLNQIKRKLPGGSNLRLYPFSIKKTPNIHGIIFGASHIRAVDKFLTIAWGINKTNGEANFDINDDAGTRQIDLFAGKRQTKIEAFQADIRKRVISGELKNNMEVYNYTLGHGHIGTHAAHILKLMKKTKEINFEGQSPLVTYDHVHKNPRLMEYTVINKKS